MKWNVHIHLSTTVGGLSPNNKKWVKNAYFYHHIIKEMWKYEVLTFFREEFKAKRLKMPPSLKHIKSYSAFYNWTKQLYGKTWGVHLTQQSDDMKQNVEYLGRYLKRPPIGETRIKQYNGKTVTCEYLDHYTKTKERMTLPVLEFMARLIRHIHDKHFRTIRYYGFLANRLSGKLLPIVYKLLRMTKNMVEKCYTTWREMIKRIFNKDPIRCPACKIDMHLIQKPHCLTLHFYPGIKKSHMDIFRCFRKKQHIGVKCANLT